MNTLQARQKISKWHEPYHGYALENIRDAERDLLRWPDLRYKILKDMTEAIKGWESVKEAGDIKEELQKIIVL